MTLKITLGTVNERAFIDGLKYLGNLKLPIKTSFNIARIIRQTDKEIASASLLYQTLLKKWCELDEKGELAPQRYPDTKLPDGTIEPGKEIPGTFKVPPEKDKDFKREYDEMLAIEVELKANKICLNDLKDQQVPANMLQALLPIISQLEEAPALPAA